MATATNLLTLGRNFPTALPRAKDVTHVIQDPYAHVFDGALGKTAVDPLKLVNEPIAAYEKMATRWKKITALLGGTQAMREHDRDFLPQEPAESDTAYENRRARSVLFNMFEKALDSMTGRPFAKAIDLNDYSDGMKELADNIDLQGNNLDVFMRPRFKNGLAYGHTAIMIDHPKNTLRENTTLQDQREQNLRPYWVGIDAKQIIGWRGVFINGVFTLTQVRIRESGTKDVGKWDVQTVERVRVLYRGTFELYERNTTNGKWQLVDQGQFVDATGQLLTFVPFVFINFKPEGHLISMPPLEGVADLNINHWQAYSDLQNIIHVAQVPILFGSGFDDDKTFTIGTSRAITGPDGSDLKYVEHSGAAIEAGRKNLEDIENRAALLGAQVLAKKPGRMTATQKVIETDTEISDLQAMVLLTEDGIDTAFDLTARWLGEDANTVVGAVDVFKDFGISMADVQELAQLVTLRAQKQITQKTLLEEFKRRGILMDNVDVETEIRLTKAETPNMADLLGDEDDPEDDQE